VRNGVKRQRDGDLDSLTLMHTDTQYQQFELNVRNYGLTCQRERQRSLVFVMHADP
jgi:hypothetical protein